METVVETRDLCVRFGSDVVLRNVHSAFKTGEIVCLIGPSGSGKTTFLRSINRLNEEFHGCVTTGQVRLQLNGQWVDAYDRSVDTAALRRHAAMVVQSPNVLPFSIEKNIALPLRLTQDLSGPAIAERVEEALRQAELFDEVKDRLRKPAQDLSGGQQQRLCLARALALRPQVLLLDEPTASLDYRATLKIEQLLRHLASRFAIMAVSHSLGQTSRLADRCLVLKEGQICEEISGDQLRDAGMLRRLADELF